MTIDGLPEPGEIWRLLMPIRVFMKKPLRIEILEVGTKIIFTRVIPADKVMVDYHQFHFLLTNGTPAHINYSIHQDFKQFFERVE